jgi:hypothetical protein
MSVDGEDNVLVFIEHCHLSSFVCSAMEHTEAGDMELLDVMQDKMAAGNVIPVVG